MNTSQLLDPFYIKGMTYAQAISILNYESHVTEKLGLDLKRAIAFLVQETAKKDVKQMSITNPFKMASYFLADKYEIRYYLKYAYSNGKTLSASNGHTLISIKADIPEGFYDANGIMHEEIDAKFPDYSKILETKTPYSEAKLSDGEGFIHKFTIEEKKKIKTLYKDQVIYKLEDKPVHFAKEYIDNAVRIVGKDCDCIIMQDRMLIVKDDVKIVIISVRI